MKRITKKAKPAAGKRTSRSKSHRAFVCSFNIVVQLAQEVWDECVLNDERAPFERLEPDEASRLRCLLSKPQEFLGSLMASESVCFVAFNRHEEPVALALTTDASDPKFPVVAISLLAKHGTAMKKG